MIKVISFDIGGTIILNTKENNYNLRSLTNLIGLPYDVVRNSYKNIFQKTKGTFSELIDEFCNELKIEKNSKIIAFFKNKFNKANNNFIYNKDIFKTFKQLKERNYKIILFSNSCCLVNNSLDKDLLNYVDKIFYSYDMGYTKSDSECYKFIENNLGFKSNEFLHIGDNLNSDYYKPIENGWNALYYGIINDNSINNILDFNELFDKLD